ALAPLLAELRIPFLIEEHLKEFLFPEHFSPFQSRLIQKTYQRATRIAGPSRSVVAAILSRFSLPGGQALVLPNPVDSTMFTLPAKSRTPNTFTWISVGLFRKEKRFDLLIKAFADLVNAVDRPQRLILVGDGPERRRMESLISSLGLQREITLTGYQSPTQVAASFRTAQAAVWAGDLETFGVAPVEALSSGLPVVITNCGGPADYVNETNGILTPPGDGPALTQAMARLQEGISQFDRNNIRQSILAYCGEEAFLSQVREVGKMLLNRG
ncbi:MAG: glycosyltransferase, partial [Fidelibacterota bacterium]